MNGAHASISPNGKYFGYGYSNYRAGECHGVISQLPKFTAIYFQSEFNCRRAKFTVDGTIAGKEWCKRYEDPDIHVSSSVAPETLSKAILALRAISTSKSKSKSKSKATLATLAACTDAVTAAKDAVEAEVCASGFVESAEWMDSRGRVIRVDGARILADGEVLLDTTEDEFAEVESGYLFEKVV